MKVFKFSLKLTTFICPDCEPDPSRCGRKLLYDDCDVLVYIYRGVVICVRHPCHSVFEC
jgi:hypothetical protein